MDTNTFSIKQFLKNSFAPWSYWEPGMHLNNTVLSENWFACNLLGAHPPCQASPLLEFTLQSRLYLCYLFFFHNTHSGWGLYGNNLGAFDERPKPSSYLTGQTLGPRNHPLPWACPREWSIIKRKALCFTSPPPLLSRRQGKVERLEGEWGEPTGAWDFDWEAPLSTLLKK